MKFDPRDLLKWIKPDHAKALDQRYTVVDHAVLVARDSAAKVLGFTVAEPRAITPEFVARVSRRADRGSFKDLRLTLYVPEFLKHRAEQLLVNHEVSLEVSSFIRLTSQRDFFKLETELRIVSVDDSPVMLKFLAHHVRSAGLGTVVAQVSDPHQAVDTILKFRPDLVTMDIQMPGLTGVQVVSELLRKMSVPVIMISSLNMEEGSLVFDALNAGAFDYIQKPRLENRAEFVQALRERALAAMTSTAAPGGASAHARKPPKKSAAPIGAYAPNLLWCIGASTGGTQAITRIFTSMPERVPPTLIVQHMPAVYSRAFAESLNRLVPFTVKEAEDGEPILADTVFIAAGGLQMGVVERSGRLHVELKNSDPVNRFKPSVDYLFNSVADMKSARVVAGILTGMGRDGAEGLLRLKRAGGAYAVTRRSKLHGVRYATRRGRAWSRGSNGKFG